MKCLIHVLYTPRQWKLWLSREYESLTFFFWAVISRSWRGTSTQHRPSQVSELRADFAITEPGTQQWIHSSRDCQQTACEPLVSHSHPKTTAKQGRSDLWAQPSEQVGILFFGKILGQRSLGYRYLLPTVTFKMEKQVSFILKGEKTFLWKSSRGETLRVSAHNQGFGDVKKGSVHVFCHTFPKWSSSSQSDRYNWKGNKYIYLLDN